MTTTRKAKALSASPWHGRTYKVTTWDTDLQQFTPQKGVPAFCKNWASLMRALRKLLEMGYAWGDPSVSVEMVDGPCPDWAEES